MTLSDAERRHQVASGDWKMATTATVQECEDYIEQHGIQGLLKECIAKICQERPANPFKWMREYFEKLERVRVVR